MTIIEDLRKPRINILGVDMALFDIGGTLFVSYLIAKKMDWNPALTMGLSIPVAYLAHKAFKVNTPLTR